MRGTALQLLKPSCVIAQTSAKGELVDLTQQGLARQIVASVAASRSYVLINLTVERHLPDGSVKHGQLTLVKLTGKSSLQEYAEPFRMITLDAKL